MAMTSTQALKKYLERDDAISPGGGKPLKMTELKELSNDERAELGKLAAAALGEEWTEAK